MNDRRYHPLLALLALAGSLSLAYVASTSSVVAPADGQSGCPPLPLPDHRLESRLLEVLGDAADHYSIVAEELETGYGAAINPYRVFYSASLYKLAVMYEVFRQRELGLLTFDDTLTVTPYFAAQDLGTLDAIGIRVGDRLTVRRLLELMITVSDNASAVMLGHYVGWRNIDIALAQLGLCSTTVQTPDPTTSAADMAALLAAIARGQAVSPYASAEMQQLLLDQKVRDRIPAGVPPDVPVGNKTGNWSNATHDVAIVYARSGTYVLAVLSDRAWISGPIVEISQVVYEHYSSGPWAMR